MVANGGADPPWQPYESRFLAGGIAKMARPTGFDPVFSS